MNQYRFQDTLISIVLGNINESVSDAIVNAPIIIYGWAAAWQVQSNIRAAG